MCTRVDGIMGAHGLLSFVFSRNNDDPNDYDSCGLSGKRETKDGWTDNVNVVDQRLGFVLSWCNEFHSNKPFAFRAARRPRCLGSLYLGGSFTKQKRIFGKD